MRRGSMSMFRQRRQFCLVSMWQVRSRREVHVPALAVSYVAPAPVD